MIPTPPLWRMNHHGDSLRRRFGPAQLRVFRKRDRGGFYGTVELRLDCHDIAEAAALLEATTAAFLQAHQAADSPRQRSA